MPPVILNEYGNQQRQRKFPFADDASLKDADGHLLPVDFIVDACLYPMDVTGPIYMSSIVPAESTVYFSDGAGHEFAKAVYAQDQPTADVTELGGYMRKLGILVMGGGIADVYRGGVTRVFDASATCFTPTACIPLVQAGVRGLILPNGDLVTGDVTFEGRDGVYASSRIQNDVRILRFDVIGTPPPLPEDCDNLSPPICTVVAERSPDSPFMISKYDDYTLALTLRGLSLDQICAAGKARFRRNNSDPCGPAPEPPEPDPGISTPPLTFALCELESGTFLIVAPSDPSYVNPISVRPLPAAAAPARRLTKEDGTDLPGTELAAERFRKPSAVGGGIVIEIQGIGRNQLP